MKNLLVGAFLGVFIVSKTAAGGRFTMICDFGMIVGTGLRALMSFTRVGVLAKTSSEKCL